MKTIILLAFYLMYFNSYAQMHWDSVSNRLNGEVKTMLSDPSMLIIGGDFTNVGSISNQGITTWNGTYFDSLGNFSCNPVYCIYRKDSLILANHCSRVFKYDGSWSELNAGMIGIPFCYEDTGGVLYVGGSFQSVNGLSPTGLATWDNLNWMNFQMPYTGSVYGVKFFKNKLYIAGSLTDSMGNKVYVVNYDGSTWTNISSGISGFSAWVSAMAVCNGKLFVAGYFRQAQGSIGNSIIMWDGNSWHPLGLGIENSSVLLPQVITLYAHDSSLYVGGIFDRAGGLPASNIAKWDGNNWCTFGSHFNNAILSISVWQSNLYVGGRFTMIDSNALFYIARWNGIYDSCTSTLSIHNLSEISVDIFPNPTKQSINIVSYGSPINEVQVYSLIGSKLYSNICKTREVEISTQDFSSGIYIFVVSIGNRIKIKKILKL